MYYKVNPITKRLNLIYLTLINLGHSSHNQVHHCNCIKLMIYSVKLNNTYLIKGSDVLALLFTFYIHLTLKYIIILLIYNILLI